MKLEFLLKCSFLCMALTLCIRMQALSSTYDQIDNQGDTVRISQIGPNAYRVQVIPPSAKSQCQYFYLDEPKYTGATSDNWCIDPESHLISFYDGKGNLLFRESERSLDKNDSGWAVTEKWLSSPDEVLLGTGQFQDGYLNVKGLTRRLTQVNTQISLPMIISDQGYGILWNNCGLTDFNPCNNCIQLAPIDTESSTVLVNVTGTEGNRQEERHDAVFKGEIEIEEDGVYAMMLDCGQSMARKHYLEVDGEILAKADNLWLPPTTSVKAYLTAGKHEILVKGNKDDAPTLFWRLDDGSNSFASDVAQCIDYTVFIGTPDQIIKQMRQLTGDVPMMPKWAFGYIHCRERYDTQQELLDNATEFRNRNIPIDMIVQDWQWWGKNGWNAMLFDNDKYPDPKAMTDSLHNMDMRIMLSVWAKVDKNSALGKDLERNSYYIPNSDWVDFFNPAAAEAYWTAYRDRLIPTGIDAWWQDATEPENDDLHERTVVGGTISGDEVRNVFPILVNDRVYKGLQETRPDTRPMILTRCGAPGIQRYGVVTWSGDVGNDYQTLYRQIIGGLGQMACGLPWWTYDAGGFFRPGDQYSNKDYQKRMLRWIQTSVFLPIMRVHGYMSQTEPWRYDIDTYDNFVDNIRLRYRLLPYIYSIAREVSQEGSTMMRPLMFDFPQDANNTLSGCEYMFGSNLLVCPVTDNQDHAQIYLPETKGGWYDFFTGQHIEDDPATKTVDVAITNQNIPVFVKAGSILPTAYDVDGIRSSTDLSNQNKIILHIYPGADGTFDLYDDDGLSNQHLNGEYSLTPIHWDDSKRILTIEACQGNYKSSLGSFQIILPDGTTKTIDYNPKATQTLNL